MRMTVPGVHGELRTYLDTEYDGDGAAVIAEVLRARRSARRKIYASPNRGILSALAKTAKALAEAFAAPGGA